MKKTMKTLLLAILTAATLAVTASATSFTSCADTLKQLGLFTGTQNGYELDRAPTRAEAATMLVRLLGKEEEAKKLTYSAPFTDLADWSKPYVQYLYEHQLANGATATKFDPNTKCTAQMYATFLMRALGYSDAASGDFTYAKALDFAAEKGVVDAMNCNPQNFLRDHVAAMSYTALATEPKNAKSDTLLAQLVSDGSVKVETAKNAQTLFATYQKYAKSQEAINEATAIDADYQVQMAMTITDNGVSQKMNTAMDGTIQMQYDPKKVMQGDLSGVKMAYTGTVKMKDENGAEMSMPMAEYVTDNTLYIESMGMKMKQELDASMLEQMKSITQMSQSNEMPISLIRSITTQKVNGKETYSVEYEASGLNGVINQLLKTFLGSMTGTGDNSMQFNITKMNMVTTLTGKLPTISADMSMNMTMDQTKMSMDMNMTMQVQKINEQVQIKFPSFSDFKPVSELVAEK